jgi:hypothetical protein
MKPRTHCEVTFMARGKVSESMSNSPRVFTRLDKFIRRKWEELTPRLQALSEIDLSSKQPSKSTQEKILRLRKVLSEARSEVSYLEARLSCRLAIEERKQSLEEEYQYCCQQLKQMTDDSRLYREIKQWGEQLRQRIDTLTQKL